jgi:hypothetical protein
MDHRHSHHSSRPYRRRIPSRAMHQSLVPKNHRPRRSVALHGAGVPLDFSDYRVAVRVVGLRVRQTVLHVTPQGAVRVRPHVESACPWGAVTEVRCGSEASAVIGVNSLATRTHTCHAHPL